MSTVKTKNVQVGTDGTASNNFTIYQPSTPDGTVRIGNGDAGAVTDAVTINSSGNVGIGTTSPADPLEISHATTSRMRFSQTTNSLALNIGQWSAKNRIEGSGGSDLIISNYDASNSIAFYTGSGGGNTERMRIDSSGRVTMPYQPAFDIAGSAGTITVNAGDTFPFNDVRANVGNHYNNSTYTFTAPVAGNYVFNFSLYGQGTIAVCYHVNGAQYGGSNPKPLAIQNTAGRNICAPALIYLNANDTVEVASRDNTNSSVFMAHSNFTGFLLG